MNALDIRPSPIAGTWYEGNAKTLALEVDQLISRVKLPQLSGRVIAVISPHAGHRYSGSVAAHAFAALRDVSPTLIAVVSPFHNFAPYPLITTKHQAYSTPLGNIEVDREVLKDLESNLEIPITALSNDKEHSLEIELPFLQRVIKNDFKLLPIMIRTQEADVARALGRALAHVLKGKKFIMVASTDLSHFHDQNTARIFDMEMLKRFESFEPGSIFDAERTGRGFACGHAAVAAVLWAGRELGADKLQVLNYATSGDITGDYSSVVGYGAAVVLKTR